MTRYVVSPDAAYAAVEDGAVVLHLGTKRYYSLNGTGAAIWQMLEDGIAGADIVTRLVQTYAVGADEARDSLAALLTELAAERLVVEAAE